MLLSGTWDVRVSEALVAYFARLQTKGAYYWKLSNTEAFELIKILCTSYNVAAIPAFTTSNLGALKRWGACGLCEYAHGNSRISTYPRPHFKTVAHEVYHHIDFYYRNVLRRPTYNSSDSKQHAWNFAERLWKAVTAALKDPVPFHICVVSDKGAVDHHAELFDSALSLGLKVSQFPTGAMALSPGTGKSLAQVSRKRLVLPVGVKLVYKIYALPCGAHVLQWVI